MTTPAQAYAGNHGGMAPTSLPAPLESAATLREAIAAHRERRPDPLVATDPESPAHLYIEWQQWCDALRHLQTKLGMAEAHEAAGWHDANGQAITPEPWRAEPTAHVSEQRRKAAEMKAYHARKAAGTTKPNGRPRSENPTKDALRCRENRAKKRGEAA